MLKLSYDIAHRLEKYTTTKLIEFINNEVKIEDILGDINSDYPLFLDDSSKISFKMWLSIDYINKDGKTFIDKFLETKPSTLSKLERKVLSDKKNSFISLFKIIEFQDEHILMLDTLQNKEYLIFKPNMNDILNKGEFIFARIGKILKEYFFIGEISYLPESVKPLFIEEFLIDFNNKRKNENTLIIKDYLKKHSIELIKNYNNCIFNAIELNEDLNSYLYDELEEFEGYLKNKTNNLKISKHISNLVDFFEYYLTHEDLTLYDLNQLDFNYFFIEAIEDKFINSQHDLNSYISTIKRYMHFLSIRNSKYKQAYLELLKISENRFWYMEKFKDFSGLFEIDRLFESYISNVLNEAAINILIDFDKFILYTLDKPLELTQKKHNIKRKHLLELYQLFEENIVVERSNPNQRDFPLIDMFFKISLTLGLMTIHDNKLTITKKGTSFISLKDEEKYTLIFNCIWDKTFLIETTSIPQDLIERSKIDFINLVSTLSENKSYDVSYIISEYKYNQDNLFQINEYLKLLGIFNSNFYPNYTWTITKLGKAIFRYLHEEKLDILKSSIVHLDNYRGQKKV